ncbi:MAG: hypothetical protein ACE5MI_08990 [Acidimicrobiia bacterium]
MAERTNSSSDTAGFLVAGAVMVGVCCAGPVLLATLGASSLFGVLVSPWLLVPLGVGVAFGLVRYWRRRTHECDCLDMQEHAHWGEQVP